jgi:TfoX/Sxy family transcriptional regulator of competence genes
MMGAVARRAPKLDATFARQWGPFMEQKELIERLRAELAGHGEVREVKMFGGICFMLDGNMAAGVSKRGLLVRVGKEGHVEATSRPGARAMEMGGREMAGYVNVDPSRLDEASLRHWAALARAYVGTLPPKASAATARRRKRG